MINVGIIGTGNIARVHASAYGQLANAKVVAVTDIDQARATAMAGPFNARVYESIDALLADDEVDMADICLPTYLHEKAVIAAAQAGKNVMCEKPVTLSLEQADRMLDAVEEAGVKVMLGQVVRFWPHYLVIKGMLDRGELGKPLMCSAARLGRLPAWDSWYSDPALSGGALLDLHIHDLDWIYSLFGMPKTVYAAGRKSPSGSWDQVLSTLDFGELQATGEASFYMPAGFPFTTSFRLLGDKGYAEYRYGGAQENPAAQNKLHTLMAHLNGQAVFPECEAADPYLAEIRYFVDCLDSGKSPEIATLPQARDVLAIALALRQSLETGEAVSLGNH